MATRCTLGIVDKDGGVRSVMCITSGAVSENGLALLKYYTKEADVRKLFSKGYDLCDLSSEEHEGEPEYIEEEEGEPPIRTHNSEEDFFVEMLKQEYGYENNEYAYLFLPDGRGGGVWKVKCTSGECTGIHELTIKNVVKIEGYLGAEKKATQLQLERFGFSTENIDHEDKSKERGKDRIIGSIVCTHTYNKPHEIVYHAKDYVLLLDKKAVKNERGEMFAYIVLLRDILPQADGTLIIDPHLLNESGKRVYNPDTKKITKPYIPSNMPGIPDHIYQRAVSVTREGVGIPDTMKGNVRQVALVLNKFDYMPINALRVLGNVIIVFGQITLKSAFQWELLKEACHWDIEKKKRVGFDYLHVFAEYDENNDPAKTRVRIVGVKDPQMRPAFLTEEEFQSRSHGEWLSKESALSAGYAKATSKFWSLHPRMMSLYRAVSFFIRVHSPELMGSTYSELEQTDISKTDKDDGGNVINIEHEEIPSQQKTK